MENYMDGSFVVSNNTVIHYSGTHEDLKVPGQFADISVSKIGDGAFMECSSLNSVLLPPDVKQIGQAAFSKCDNLRQITLPGGVCNIGGMAFFGCGNLSSITICDLELTAQEHQMYKSTGIRSPEDGYILRKMPDHPLISMLISSFADTRAAYEVPEETSHLFHTAQIAETVNVSTLHREWSTLGVTQPSAQVSENDAFCSHISRLAPEFYDGKTEQKNDWHVRMGKTPDVVRTVVFTFDDTKTKQIGRKFLIHAVLKRGYFFWQSAQPVMHENKKYYIYRRHYLNHEADMKYVRRDIAVYTDKGLVMDRKEAQNVYGKYRLLSIL